MTVLGADAEAPEGAYETSVAGILRLVENPAAQPAAGVAAIIADQDRAVSERSAHSRNFTTSAAIGSKQRFHRMDI